MDDDNDIYCGGVVFMYDVTNIMTFVLHHHNTRSRTKEWVAIYTGNSEKWDKPSDIYINHDPRYSMAIS